MKILIPAFLMLSAALLSAGNFLEVPTAEKLKDKDLTFAVTFDNRSVNADLAKGNPISTTMKDVGLSLRGCVGFDTKQAFQPVSGEDLKFETNGNVSPHNGTLTMWVKALDYDPGAELTNGKKRGNVALLRMWFQQGARHLDYQLYEYADTVYFDWRSSEPPNDFGQVGRVQVSRKGIKQKEWHQIAVTWTDRKIAIFLNGNSGGEAMLPAKAAKTMDLEPDKDQSYLGIKSRFYEDQHTWGVAVDDVKVYARVLSPLEIKNQYQKLLLGQAAGKLQSFEVKLNGVDEGDGHKLDQIEAEFDFSALPPEVGKQLESGKLEVKYTLTGPGKFIRSGTWTMQKPSESRRISGIVAPGRYHLEATIQLSSSFTRLFSSGNREKNTADIDVPDLSFLDNGVGAEDIVPKIWQPFTTDKDRTVHLWNRTYTFGVGPLPTAITVYGQPLLKKAPELAIETAAGASPIQYRAGNTVQTNCAVTFKGTGTAPGFTLDYATTVEFDGLIKFDFVINGQPEIKSMHLAWQVEPGNCQFLMTPTLQEKPTSEFAFKYPTEELSPATQLWLVAEGKGGFSYSMANDANWVYDPSHPVFKVNKATGSCSVEMIAKTVRLPAATPYQALFIATPTRPLPEKVRVIRNGDSTSSASPHFGTCAGEGLTGVGTFKPHPTAFAEQMKGVLPGVINVYGTADALTTGTPIANYFKIYWDIPGYYIYKMSYKKPLGDGKFEMESYFTVSACDATHIKDYLLGNIKELLEHPYADRIGMIYYDLCGNVLCGNPLHGCGFKDKFGRDIKTFELLSKRKLVERTVRLCHASNRVVMTHNQRWYNPMLNGLADYYYPGEQHNGMLRRNPYGYTDELSDNLYRSEYNRDALGVGVIFLTALGQADTAYLDDPALTEAMLTMLLAHDIEPDPSYSAVLPHQKVWDILEKYQVQSPQAKAHLYYRQDTVVSSNPGVRVTYYECPEQQYVLALTNKDISAQKSIIDLSRLKAGDYTVREEYQGSDIQVKDGKFEITVPSRSFRLVAFPPKSFYPVIEAFRNRWGSWKDDGSEAEFSLDPGAGHEQPPAMMMTIGGKGTGCFLKGFPVKPEKTYTAAVWVKQENAKNATLSFQGMNVTAFIGEPPINVSSPAAAGWRHLELDFTIPAIGKWAKCNRLLVTLSAGAANSITWFDDFTLTEK